MTDEDIISAIILREGGYVDNPADRGGPTNFGITQATLSDYRGVPCTPSDVRAMTQGEAHGIYKRNYIEKPGFTLIKDDALRSLLVDCAVNHGPKAAVKMLQRAVGVPDDGVLGNVTITGVNALDSRRVRANVTAERATFYGTLISTHHEQAEFAAGWMNRLAEFIRSLG